MPDKQHHRFEATSQTRVSALLKMADEHVSGLEFAAEINKIAEQGTEDELASGIEKVIKYNREELEPHLQLEEQTILGPLMRSYPEHTQLCIKIGKEHGYIRSLVEEMSPTNARNDLSDFSKILEHHTLLENEQLFPLVETLFSDEQLEAIENFVPLRPKALGENQNPRPGVKQTPDKERWEWLSDIKAFCDGPGQQGGSIVLLPRFSPDVIEKMAEHIGLEMFDFQQEVMQGFGPDAHLISFEQLDQSLRNRAQQNGIVSHNIEALLCVNTKAERRAWITTFLNGDWPNPILLPITVFQAEVPDEHHKVCDLELRKMPRNFARKGQIINNRNKYHLEND